MGSGQEQDESLMLSEKKLGNFELIPNHIARDINCLSHTFRKLV